MLQKLQFTVKAVAFGCIHTLCYAVMPPCEHHVHGEYSARLYSGHVTVFVTLSTGPGNYISNCNNKLKCDTCDQWFLRGTIGRGKRRLRKKKKNTVKRRDAPKYRDILEPWLCRPNPGSGKDCSVTRNERHRLTQRSFLLFVNAKRSHV